MGAERQLGVHLRGLLPGLIAKRRFNNLHFTFADWWGSLGPNPASTITLYPDTNLIKTRVVGAPFGFNSGDSFDEDTDTFVYALNGKWQVSDRFTLEADLSIQESQFETDFIAVRTERVPRRSRWISMPRTAFRPGISPIRRTAPTSTRTC